MNKNITKTLITTTAFLLFSTSVLSETTANYKITFKANWNAQTHNLNHPGSAHFSTPIGTTHNTQARIWQRGTLASTGVENVAETGSTTVLRNEINSMIANQNAQSIITMSLPFDDVFDAEQTFSTTESFPLFSMLTMIAPSPDWFLGVDSVDLRENSSWRQSITIDLFPYDAGTEDGNIFSLSNDASSPLENIFRITGEPFKEGAILGQFVIELQSVTGEVVDPIFKNSFESN